ncbi:MAG: C-GCAxxG-C-C family protein [Chloroflexota bacterium]
MSTEARNAMLNSIESEARALEKDYHGCSRCVLIPLQKHLGLANGAVARAASPLAGGIALSGEACGALTGSLLAIGLAVAPEDLNDRDGFLNAMTSGFRFRRRFEKQFEETTCRGLQTARLGNFYSMADPTAYKRFVELGGYETCSAIVGAASRLAAEFILELHDKGMAQLSIDI